MSRTKEGRDALRSSEAHPQARSIAPAWAQWSQRRVPVGRHRPKLTETGEAHPPSGANLRRMRRRAQLCVADSRRRRPPRPPQERVFQRNTSTPAVRFAQIADIDVEPRSGRSLPAIRATAVARSRSDPERRHGLGMLKRRAGRVDANLTGRWIDLPMPLLVTSASGANGNGYGALLAFDHDGEPLGPFSDDDRIV